MLMTLVVALAALLVVQQPAATGQPASAALATATAAIAVATGPEPCVTAARAFVGKRQQEVRPPTGYTSEVLKQVDLEKQALVQTCVNRFGSAATPDSNLAGLADLYSEAGQPALAKTTIDRALASRTLSEPDRADALAMAVRITLKEPKGDARNAVLEQFVGNLDKLSAACFDQKFEAHRAMLGYYRYDDLDGGIITHATWLIDASKNFSPEQRKRNASSVVNAHVDMAEAWAGQGMNDQAIALLRKAKAEWSDTPRVADMVDPEIARLELVGTPGATLTAPRWLNLPAGKADLDLKGSVTLLEFSAHWCVPCKESYPGVNRLRQKYGPKGFQVVIATQLYGYFQTERNLDPAAEFDRDKTYFAEHGLDVPIAVGPKTPAPTRKADGTYEYQRDPNDDHYRVGGIPQIMLIDKAGKIRLMMVGYDDANEEKLAKMIEGLLKEK